MQAEHSTLSVRGSGKHQYARRGIRGQCGKVSRLLTLGVDNPRQTQTPLSPSGTPEPTILGRCDLMALIPPDAGISSYTK